jgi:hypothetical protein
MKNRIAKILGLALIGAVVLTISALPARASTPQAEVVWINSSGSTVENAYNCVDNSTHTQPGYYIYTLYNGCSTRIWAHENSDGSGAASCAPQGFLSPAIPFNAYQFQMTANTSVCDTYVGIYWENSSGISSPPRAFPCSQQQYIQTGFWIGLLSNSCGNRVWMHQYDDGTGAAQCEYAFTNDWIYAWGTGQQKYWQFQVTANGYPCP